MFAWDEGGHYSKAELQRMFPDIYPSNYWSSTTFVNYTSLAWYVGFYYGPVYYSSKSNSNYVRCVRGAALQQAKEKAKEEGRLTVIDPKTDLMWQRGGPGIMYWERARSYCQNLSLAGYTDWRLPDKETLQQMFAYSDGGHYSEAELRRMFPDIPPSGYTYYWSSATHVDFTSFAWGVSFYSGYVSYYNKSNNHYVRCVRGSK
jgi:hypothetical protein